MTMQAVNGVNKIPGRRLAWVVGSVALLLPIGLAAQQPRITGISHVTLYADNMGLSQAFYAGLLGWEPVSPMGSDAGPRFYANHEQYVELLPPPTEGQMHRLDRVAFATDDAEGLRKALARKGMAVPAAVTLGEDGSRSFLVHDPEGNPVEFTQQVKSPATPSKAALARRLSTHILHAGYAVHDRAALDHFYKDGLGFHLYWQGGAKAGNVDWVMMQVPDGTDWIEYVLYLPATPTRAQMGGAYHIAPGVVSVAELQAQLEQRGWKPPEGKSPQVLGVDGKLQLDLTDPDGTRIEFMEYAPVKPACCSAYTGTQPVPSDAW